MTNNQWVYDNLPQSPNCRCMVRPLIPIKLHAMQEWAKLYGARLEIFLDGVLQEYVWSYDIQAGYVDKHQMKAHNQGADVVHTPVGLGDRFLVNRLFGKVEVKWKF